MNKRFVTTAIFLAATLSTSGACRPKEGPIPVCLSEVVGEDLQDGDTQSLPPDIWFGILLKPYNRNTKQLGEPARDCSGRPLIPVTTTEEKQAVPTTSNQPNALGPSTVKPAQPAKAAPVCPAYPPFTPTPSRALTPQDLVQVPLDEKTSLVWVAALHDPKLGQARGPVALIERTQRGIAVRALGLLQLPPERVGLRLEMMGASQVLVAEGESCTGKDSSTCVRMAAVLPRIGDRFTAMPMVLDSGACDGPALFSLFRQQLVKLSGQKHRMFELTRTLQFNQGNAVVSEQVLIRDKDPSQPDSPAKKFRDASSDRALQLTASGLLTSQGLWERMFSEHGSVEVRPER